MTDPGVLRLLVLGGTAWLSRVVAETAAARGHRVTTLARGESGPPAEGVEAIRGDRSTAAGYQDLVGRDWDAVIDVAREPRLVATALAALADRSAHWAYVSSCSVYAAHDTPGADESAALLPALHGQEWTPERYGEGKVAAEELVRATVGAGRALVARSGLISGPGDHTDRTGYWPLRFAHPAAPDGAVLVPDSPTLPTQLVDVRDLAGWLVEGAERGRAGTYNVMGPALPLPEHLRTARAVSGHDGPLVPVAPDWLAAHGVQPWTGPRSLPLWLPLPEYAGFMARDASAAVAAGLVCRPLAETLEDTLAWELRTGPGRPRRAGLSPVDEIELLALARGT